MTSTKLEIKFSSDYLNRPKLDREYEQFALTTEALELYIIIIVILILHKQNNLNICAEYGFIICSNFSFHALSFDFLRL